MSEAPHVTVAQGEVAGTMDFGVAAYLGLPYAAAPFGELRMQPPAPPPAWHGVRDATAFGPTVPKAVYPPQYAALLADPVIAGEESLNLNVWTPDPTGSGLPVFVWIHGGSFTNGSGGIYNGAAFARDGIVCVTINYRLQAEGFLHTADGTSNLGLLDQLAALAWVRDNIAAFGGDPGKVTVGGESAGAMSVTTLLSMPQAAGLFRSAIAQSGAAAHVMPPEVGSRVTEWLAADLGVEPTRSALAAVSPQDVVAAAQRLQADVRTAPDRVQRWGALTASLLPFMPTVDGEVLPRPPLDAIASGAGADVALMTGTNGEEMRLFLVADRVIDHIDEAAFAGGAQAYGLDPSAAAAAYAPEGTAPGDALSALVTDWFFAVPAVRVAEARAATGSATWMYRFDHRSLACEGTLGAAHAVEIPFVFDTLDEPETEDLLGPGPSQAVADTVHATWVRFIRDADPGWAAYDMSRRTTMVFGEQDGPVENPRAERYALWEGIR
ncbi:MAG: carboxylesterase family protein [Terracoccus sp.]